MKLAHVSDIHLDERRGDSGESLDEQVQRLLWIGEDARDADAEIMLVAGDTFHHSKSSAAERNAAVKVYQALAEHFPVVCVKGNNAHDGPGEIAFLSELKAKNEIRVFERPGEYITKTGDIIACLPFPEKSWLAAKVEQGQDVDQVAVQALRAILLGYNAKFNKHPGVSILLGHLELGTAISDSGQPMTGKCFVELSEGDLLDAGADLYALGHIHKFQLLGSGHICYSGSVRQTTHGEDNIKGYCLVNVERNEKPVIEHRKAPGRELITVTAEWTGVLDNSHVDLLDSLLTQYGMIESVKKGSIVRLTYHVEDSNREKADELANSIKQQFLLEGAHSVKLDPRIETTYRVRSESIRKAKTNEERLDAWWNSRGNRPDREKQIKDKLNVLESEVS